MFAQFAEQQAGQGDADGAITETTAAELDPMFSQSTAHPGVMTLPSLVI